MEAALQVTTRIAILRGQLFTDIAQRGNTTKRLHISDGGNRRSKRKRPVSSILNTMKKMERLLELIFFTSFWIVSSKALDVKTTCSAPPAYVGEPGAVACYFPVDVNVEKVSFNVRRADRHDFDYNRDTVIDCDWIDGEQTCLTIKEGFTYDYKVSRHLTIIIPNVTLEHQGMYSCQLFMQAAKNIQICDLTVTEREEISVNSSETITTETPELPPTPELQKGETLVQTGGLKIIPIVVVPCVIGPVLIFAFAVLVYMFKRRHVDDSEEGNSNARQDDYRQKRDTTRMLDDEIGAGDTAATLINYSEGNYDTVTFEIENVPPPLPLESGAKANKKKRDDYAKVNTKKQQDDHSKVNKKNKRDDYAKVNKKKKKATTPVENHVLELQDQERQPLTNDQGNVSPESRNQDENEEEAAYRSYPKNDDSTSENGNAYGRNEDNDDNARYSDTDGREFTDRDFDISDDERLQRGDSPEKREHKKKFKVVVKQIIAHNATGNRFKNHVPDEARRGQEKHVTA